MFIARRDLSTLLCSEERHSFELDGDRHAALSEQSRRKWLAGL